MRLVELNNDIIFFMDQKNPELYKSSQAVEIFDGVKKNLQNDLRK